jgi:predicted nucleic acid-binding protein
VTYADTSALVKLLVEEPESEALVQYLSGLSERTTSSELTVAELLRVALRSGADAEAATILLGQLDLLAVNEATFWRAPPEGSRRQTESCEVVTAVAYPAQSLAECKHGERAGEGSSGGRPREFAAARSR